MKDRDNPIRTSLNKKGFIGFRFLKVEYIVWDNKQSWTKIRSFCLVRFLREAAKQSFFFGDPVTKRGGGVR